MKCGYRAVGTFVLALSALCGTGTTCIFIPPSTSDTVEVNFLNDTDFDVNAFINGTLVDLVPAHSNPPSTFVNCSPGASFQIDGDFLAQEGDIPAVNSLVFDEGSSVLCGDTIDVDFFIDDNGNFALDGQAIAPTP